MAGVVFRDGAVVFRDGGVLFADDPCECCGGGGGPCGDFCCPDSVTVTVGGLNHSEDSCSACGGFDAITCDERSCNGSIVFDKIFCEPVEDGFGNTSLVGSYEGPIDPLFGIPNTAGFRVDCFKTYTGEMGEIELGYHYSVGYDAATTSCPPRCQDPDGSWRGGYASSIDFICGFSHNYTSNAHNCGPPLDKSCVEGACQDDLDSVQTDCTFSITYS